MPRYLVVKRRDAPATALTSQGALQNEPDVKLLDVRNPNMVLIEATEDKFADLKTRLQAHYYVEPELRRRMH
jgi:hypothetical protein